MSNIEQILQYVDHLISEETESNLTAVQEAILIGVWEKQGYSQIAKEFHCSESHIKKEASKLWKILGETLGKDINKKNFRSNLEKKYRVSQGDNFGYCVQVNEGYIFYDKSLQSHNNQQNRSPSSNSENQSPQINQKDLPVLNYSYGRKTEIFTLKNWLENQTKLITIYGLSKIGKTALILKLIPEIKEIFDYIFYRTLDNKPTLINLKDELKQFFAQSQEKPLPKVIDYFRSSRCLVILDDVHNIFNMGDLAGQYLPEFKDYGRFFQKVASLDHQSCIILISWEKPQQFDQLEAENFNVKTLHLRGLGEDAKAILTAKGLKDEDQYLKLINLYQGNPSWLNLIANIIKDDFNGEISQFLGLDELCLEGIEIMLESHLERLSEAERNLINNLADQDQAINIKQQSIKIRKSLIRRGLIEQILQENEIKYQLNPIFKTYLNS